MPDPTEYETGARHRVEKTQPDDNENFSQDAATNKRPPSGMGNSESVDDANEKTRHSDGQNPGRRPPSSPASQKTAGAGPAIAERSKDAKTTETGRQPGAYVKE